MIQDSLFRDCLCFVYLKDELFGPRAFSVQQYLTMYNIEWGGEGWSSGVILRIDMQPEGCLVSAAKAERNSKLRRQGCHWVAKNKTSLDQEKNGELIS